MALTCRQNLRLIPKLLKVDHFILILLLSNTNQELKTYLELRLET